MALTKEIFRAGSWEDSSGKEVKFTESDIDDIIANFDNEKSMTKEGRKVPLTVGHPNDNAPAFGWVKKIWRDGKKLFAEFMDMSDIMLDWIKQKAYSEVSIALTGKTLRHVGVLGGVPPAVPNMGAFKFADDCNYEEFQQPESFVSKFISWFKEAGTTVQSLIFSKEMFNKSTAVSWAKDHGYKSEKVDENDDSCRLRQYEPSMFRTNAMDNGQTFATITLKKGIKAVIGKLKTNLNKGDDMDELKKALSEIATLKANQEQLNSKFESVEKENTGLKKKVDDLEKENKDFKADKEKSEKELKELKAEKEKETELKADEKDTAEVDSLIKEFKVAPAEKDALLITLKSLRGQKEHEFAMDDGSKKKMQPREHYLETLKARPQIVAPGPQYNHGTPKPEGKSKVELLIEQKQKENKELSYSEASKEVFFEHPELTAQDAKVAA